MGLDAKPQDLIERAPTAPPEQDATRCPHDKPLRVGRQTVSHRFVRVANSPDLDVVGNRRFSGAAHAARGRAEYRTDLDPDG